MMTHLPVNDDDHVMNEHELMSAVSLYQLEMITWMAW